MAALTKNIGKWRQWTNEKLGSAGKTELSEHFRKLQHDVELRREHVQSLHTAFQQFIKTLEAKKMDGGAVLVPLEAVGNVWLVQGNMCEEVQGNGKRVAKGYREAGKGLVKVAGRQCEMAREVREGYGVELEEYFNEFKAYEHLKKKLENRRLDFDSKLNRLQKSKKENPDLEDQMRASQLKYEETLQDIVGKMEEIRERESGHLRAVTGMVRGFAGWLREGWEVMQRVEKVLDGLEVEEEEVAVAEGGRDDVFARPGSARNGKLGARGIGGVGGAGGSRTSSSSSFELRAGGVPAPPPAAAAPPMVGGHPLPGMANPAAFSGSRAHPHRGSATRSNSAHLPLSTSSSSGTGPPPPPPASSSARSSPSQPPLNPSLPSTTAATTRKYMAEYPFEPESHLEMRLSKGDVVSVMEEIDPGWWIGEILDPKTGLTRKGMFPSNYVKPLQQTRPPPPPPMSSKPSVLGSATVPR